MKFILIEMKYNKTFCSSSQNVINYIALSRYN